MNAETGIQALMELGFTRLEAEIYTFLVQNPPATGYRIAQAIGKPAANVYKSLQSLGAKGALLVDDSDNKLHRAIDPGELLDRLQRHFDANRERAVSTLSALKQDDNDDRIYHLKTRDQVFERCRDMLANGREIIVVDAYPDLLEMLKPDIAETIKRGVSVAVHAYQPVFIPGAEVFDRDDGERYMRRWPGSWINVIKDGEEYIISFFDRNTEVIQAVWSSSPYLSWVYYSALLSDLQLVALKNKIHEGASQQDLERLLQRYNEYFTLEASGYKKLRKRFSERAQLPAQPSVYKY